MTNQQLGELFQTKREAKGWTLRDAAANLDISPATLSRIERAERKPNFYTLRRVAEFCGVSLDEVETV